MSGLDPKRSSADRVDPDQYGHRDDSYGVTDLFPGRTQMTEGPTMVSATHSQNRQRVMWRFERVVEENLDGPLCVPEMCAMVGVADRTLRKYCQKHLGMSPRRYLWVRRMHHVRQALARADAAVKTVTEISTDHGFLE